MQGHIPVAPVGDESLHEGDLQALEEQSWCVGTWPPLSCGRASGPPDILWVFCGEGPTGGKPSLRLLPGKQGLSSWLTEEDTGLTVVQSAPWLHSRTAGPAFEPKSF